MKFYTAFTKYMITDVSRLLDNFCPSMANWIRDGYPNIFKRGKLNPSFFSSTQMLFPLIIFSFEPPIVQLI